MLATFATPPLPHTLATLSLPSFLLPTSELTFYVAYFLARFISLLNAQVVILQPQRQTVNK